MDNERVYVWAEMGLRSVRDHVWNTYQSAKYTGQKRIGDDLSELLIALSDEQMDLAIWRKENCERGDDDR